MKHLAASLVAASMMATPAGAADAVKIGFVSTFSGPPAAIGNDMRDGFNLGLDNLGRQMAGRPVEAMALIALGYRSISMAPASIGPVKAMVLSANTKKLRQTVLELIGANCPTIRRELTEFAQKENIDI